MKFANVKEAYVAWNGSNMDEVLEFCAPVLFEGTSYAVSAVGDQLHYQDQFEVVHVLPPGTVLLGYGTPRILTAEEFAFQYDALPS